MTRREFLAAVEEDKREHSEIRDDVRSLASGQQALVIETKVQTTQLTGVVSSLAEMKADRRAELDHARNRRWSIVGWVVSPLIAAAIAALVTHLAHR